jgi:hypothetical protein
MKNLIVIFLIVAIFSGCASSKTIKNNIKTLGMIGTKVETANPDVATAKIKKSEIVIKSIAEGTALLIVSNNFADITILNVNVSKKRVISIENMVMYIEQESNYVLEDTMWSYSDKDGSERLHFYSGTKGIYTFTDPAGLSHSLNFSYKVSENKVILIFSLNGLTTTTGIISTNTITLQIIGDKENTLLFKKTKYE